MPISEYVNGTHSRVFIPTHQAEFNTSFQISSDFGQNWQTIPFSGFEEDPNPNSDQMFAYFPHNYTSLWYRVATRFNGTVYYFFSIQSYNGNRTVPYIKNVEYSENGTIQVINLGDLKKHYLLGKNFRLYGLLSNGSHADIANHSLQYYLNESSLKVKFDKPVSDAVKYIQIASDQNYTLPILLHHNLVSNYIKFNRTSVISSTSSSFDTTSTISVDWSVIKGDLTSSKISHSEVVIEPKLFVFIAAITIQLILSHKFKRKS